MSRTSAPSFSGSRVRPRHGFTLVELLVVIGIIALLISILMPAMSRAREQGNGIKCLSNLRQAGMAFTMYLMNNKDHFPRPSPRAPSPQRAHDWLHWEKEGPNKRDINQSALAPYLGTPVNEEALRCPSDDLAAHVPAVEAPAAGAYKFSYTMNGNFFKVVSSDYVERAKGSQVVNPTSKILLVDEENAPDRPVNDGIWYVPPIGGSYDYLSVRHDARKQLPDKNQEANMDRRGNAAFVDGHAEFISRREAYKVSCRDPLAR